MELYQISYFIEIARQRSFTRAAERLRMAQPALSQQMKNLEAELGAELFIRGRRETQLSAVGKVFLPHAEGLLAQAEEAKAVVSDVTQMRGGQLVIAAIPSVSACLLPVAIHQFSRKHSKVRLRLIEESSEHVAGSVEAGHADIGFLQLPASKTLFETRTLVEEPFVALVSRSHFNTDKIEISLGRLARESFIFYKGRARDTAVDACRKAGFEPNVVCESGELETIRGLVAAGLGVALLPKLASGNLSNSVRAIKVREPSMRRQIAAVWKKGSTPTPAAAALLQILSRSMA